MEVFMPAEKLKKLASDNIDIGISKNNRKEIVENLKSQLSDTYILQLKTQFYHWNVTGGNFHQLHLLFGSQYDELALAVDELAERTRSLGFNVIGTFNEFLKFAQVTEDKLLPQTSQEMLENLLSAHEHIAKTTREKIANAQKNGDEGTADLFIKRLQEHEKTAWFLRSHL
jgi:starvation-inducible DNA-binding protein